MIFQEVILHDFTKPLAKRAADRKFCGPYRWTPSEPGKGRGFYMASKGLACARHGAGFDLRLELANDHLGQSRVDGYYCDRDCDGDMLQPIIARLAHGRGFLAGWTMGAGMCAAMDTDCIYNDAESAAYAAHSKAEYDAEESRDREEESDE